MNKKFFIKLSGVSLFIFAMTQILVLNHFRKDGKRRTVDSVRIVRHSPLFRALRNMTYFKAENNKALEACSPQSSSDRQRVYRDILRGNTDASLFGKDNSEPGILPSTAHYVWCGKKLFLYENYLSVLSIVRVHRPMKIVFHYNHLPTELNLYNSWFQELRQSLPNLVLRRTSVNISCNSSDGFHFGLEQLAASVGGGVYFGERAILTFIPSFWKEVDYVTYITRGVNSSEEVIVYARQGLVEHNVTIDEYKQEVHNLTYECFSMNKLNDAMSELEFPRPTEFSDVISPCLIVPRQLHPEHIVNDPMTFGQVVRNLHYGTTNFLSAQPGKDPKDLIPAISHIISLNPHPYRPVEWTFTHYLSVLSALYVGGFHRVYIHGDTPPSGIWWDKLQGENITFVYIDNMETIYQQKASVLAHQSDALRALILLKYGGAYQDKDVIWANPVPEGMRRFPALMAYDWPRYEEWPHSVNMGVIMAKPGVTFLRKLLDSFWFYKDNDWVFNGVLMPYKIFENYPDSVLIYGKLQIICYVGICHPTWHRDYLRPYEDAGKPTGKFTLDEPHAFHFTYPKPHASLVSFDTIKKGNDIAARVGQRLVAAVERAGKQHLVL